MLSYYTALVMVSANSADSADYLSVFVRCIFQLKSYESINQSSVNTKSKVKSLWINYNEQINA